MFKALDREDIKKIVNILIEQLNTRLRDKGIRMELSEEVLEFLAEKGYDQEYGARPLRRSIQKYIEDPLSVKLIEKAIPEKAVVEVTLKDDVVDFQLKMEEPVLAVGVRD